jgi:hypothetical protein
MVLLSKRRENTTHQFPLIRVKPFGIQGLSLTATSLTSVSFAEPLSLCESAPDARSITPSTPTTPSPQPSPGTDRDVSYGVGQSISTTPSAGPAERGAEAAPRDHERVVVEPGLAG